MTRQRQRAKQLVVAGVVLIAGALASADNRAYADLEFAASWQPVAPTAARDAVTAWAAQPGPDDEALAQIDAIWSAELSDGRTIDLLDAVAASIAVVDPRAADLVAACRRGYVGPALPDAAWLHADDASPLAANNLRLYYARWLAQFGLYDEVLAELDGLAPGDVLDPASLLFYRMIAHQQLVQPDEARAALAQLVEHREALPERFAQIARLLERDLASIEDDSLDHIARRMHDIRRRLGYGRTGERVQTVERGVLESLDKLIEEIEEQARQQQQQSQAGGQGGAMQPIKPMEDSMLPSMRAAMQVDQRDIGDSSGWGDLPPRERERALQQVGREFPAHYRELIEQYFRELAADEN